MQQTETLCDHRSVPRPAVLPVEGDQSAGTEPGAASFGQQQQGEQSGASGWSGRRSCSWRARRIASSASSVRSTSGPRGRVALVEDEVDDLHHRRKPVVDEIRWGTTERLPGAGDRRLGPADALGHGGFGQEQGIGDLPGGEAAHGRRVRGTAAFAVSESWQHKKSSARESSSARPVRPRAPPRRRRAPRGADVPVSRWCRSIRRRWATTDQPPDRPFRHASRRPGLRRTRMASCTASSASAKRSPRRNRAPSASGAASLSSRPIPGVGSWSATPA